MEGSDDILFAGTDVGIFKWNKPNNEWELFNEGMPPCIVMDMEINYCAGKLHVATYGRGIWETPIFEDDYNPQGTVIISTNTTWTTDKYLRGSIRIDSGATLTIGATDTPTLYMPKNGEIIINPGGKLVVNKAKFTNSCKGCFWNGIRVVGQPNKVQITLNHQGVAYLNEAIIEHAKIGVANHSSDGLPHQSAGGVIHATKSLFLNNIRAVELQSYQLKTSLQKNYRATFAQCVFDINPFFRAGSSFESHVMMTYIDGPSFSGCQFYNRRGTTLKGEGVGIYSKAYTGFNMNPYCTSMTIPCVGFARNKFSGFRAGILINDVNAPYHIKINGADFDSCSIGIKTYYKSHITITNDSFKVGRGKTIFLDSSSCHNNIGIWSDQSHFAEIENNHFQGYNFGGQHPSHQNYGAFIANGEVYNKSIYKNTFNNLDVACIAKGRNGNHVQGLSYLCNTYDDNDYDIYVVGAAQENVAQFQGNHQLSAGNLFLDASAAHWAPNTLGPGNTYYYNGANTQPNGNIITTAATTARSCPTRFNIDGTSGWQTPINTPDLISMTDFYGTRSASKGALVSTYNGLLDGGNTSELVNYITMSTQADSPTVRTTMLGYSPYLTHTALKALANANILGQPQLVQVLEANPEMLRDETFLEYLGNDIPQPLTGGEIDQLRMTATTSTARSEIESELTELGLETEEIRVAILNHYLSDTTDWEIDSIIHWMDEAQTLTSEYDKVEYFTSIGDYTEAASILDNIPSAFTLSGAQETEHNLYVELWNILEYIHEDGRTIYQLDDAEESQIMTIANDIAAAGTRPVAKATSLLNQFLGIIPIQCIVEEKLPPSDFKPGRDGVNNDTSPFEQERELQKLYSNNNLVKAYPNPATDYIIFEYTFVEPSGNPMLLITNTTGQRIREIKLYKQVGKMEWNTQNIPAGVYIYQLKDGNTPIDIGRIVITK